jgi:hypothetical protein
METLKQNIIKKISIFATMINHSFSVPHQLCMKEKLSGRTNHSKYGVL